jgi:dTDP-4-amino-4,6-dideoxygalactose transaminase
VTGGGRLTPLPPLPPGVLAQRAQAPPFPLGEPRCRLYARARHGLWEAMRAAGLGPGDTVLAPAFHHGSEIEAFQQAGLGCRFYEVTERFEPDPEELDQLLEPSVRALHLVHYLGFPQQSARWRRWCDDRGLLLIEDAAQAWLARLEDTPVGCHGDVSVFCLYKTYGVPDGAALWTRAIDATAPLPGRGGLGAVARRQASWLLQRSSAMSALREAFEHRPAFSHVEDIALGDVGNGPSRATVRLLPRLGGEAATKRRANYRWLMDRLGEHVPAPFRVLPAGASPFVFPIETAEKDLMAERLRRHRIEALGFWTLPHPSLPEGFDRSAAARRRWLGLPVHQELEEEDLRRIVDATCRSMGSSHEATG